MTDPKGVIVAETAKAIREIIPSLACGDCGGHEWGPDYTEERLNNNILNCLEKMKDRLEGLGMTCCEFHISWVGPCGQATFGGTRFCDKHKNLRCAVCGEQAVRDCDASVGGLMCGFPLCSECNHHGEVSDGCRKDPVSEGGG